MDDKSMEYYSKNKRPLTMCTEKGLETIKNRPQVSQNEKVDKRNLLINNDLILKLAGHF